jgi:hypothetical protein
MDMEQYPEKRGDRHLGIVKRAGGLRATVDPNPGLARWNRRDKGDGNVERRYSRVRATGRGLFTAMLRPGIRLLLPPASWNLIPGSPRPSALLQGQQAYLKLEALGWPNGGVESMVLEYYVRLPPLTAADER